MIDPSHYLPYLAYWNRKILHDALLVEELYRAAKGENNGITLWRQDATPTAIADILKYYGAQNPQGLVLVLSPSGIPLTRDPSNTRDQLADIWC